jgi:hypothetical protein
LDSHTHATAQGQHSQQHYVQGHTYATLL